MSSPLLCWAAKRSRYRGCEMNQVTIERTFRISLRIYASILIVAGIAHGVWYWFFPAYDELIGLTNIQWSTFFLFNWSISILLVFLSILSYVVSWTGALTVRHLRTFSVLTICFWICRLLLEFIFPVRIPFVVIPNPSWVLKTLILIAMVILAIPELRLRVWKENEKV